MTLGEAVTTVAVTITVERSPGIMFDELVERVREIHADADVCAIDAAARPYQRGEPGAYTYEPIEDPPEGRT